MMSIGEIRKLPFMFIVARGRSGTTLMQTILDANENVIFPIESRLIIHLKKKYFHVKKWTPKLIDEFIEDLYKDKKFARYWSVDREKLSRNIHAYLPEDLDFSALCKIVYLSYPSPFPKERIMLIGDKNPIFSIFIKELMEVFPDARFIHLVRDYRDNITSNRQVFKRQSIALLTHGWKAYNIFIERIKEKNPGSFYSLKYEELAADPMKYVPEICTFLNITFNTSMLDFHTTMEQVKSKGEKYKVEIDTVHPHIVKPVNTAQINKWKNVLSESEIELADYIAGDYARKFGYIRATAKCGFSFPIKSALGWLRIHMDMFLIKSYYTMPFFIRDAIGKFNLFLYKKFRITNYYNQADFRFKE